MKATNILRNEHREIIRALDVMERMAEQREKGESLDHRDVEDILRFFRLFVDSHHQGKEEMILFPALLKDRAQRHHAELSQLIFAHNQERSLVVGLEDAIETSNAKDFVYYVKRLSQVLRAHIEEEDRRLFALAEATLSAKEDEEVAHELEEFERHWRDTVLTGLFSRLSQMEHAGASKR
jgi:hemerythrin-like domain-containing protein